MGILDSFFGWTFKSRTNAVYRNSANNLFNTYFSNLPTANNGVPTFCSGNAYATAKSLAEIFIPIDIISDRVASVNYQCTDLEGKEIEKVPENIKRLLARPNPFQNLGGLVYQMQFSELAQGGSYNHAAFSGKTKKSELIDSLYSIEPNKIIPTFKKNIPAKTFLIEDYSELVSGWTVLHFAKINLLPEDVKVYITGSIGADLLPESPLKSVELNINNLFAVYSARYKNYINNGNAGILTRKIPNDSLSNLQDNSDVRQEIINEMSASEGIVGVKNFIGISSHELNFIKTIGTISELEPFKETVVDLITIGAALNVDKDLLPREDGTTFTNKREAEKQLWQNTIIPFAQTKAAQLTELLMLENSGYKITADYSKVPILQEDMKTNTEIDLLEIEKIERLQALGVNVNKYLKQWEI